MDVANIHAVTRSYEALREICVTARDNDMAAVVSAAVAAGQSSDGGGKARASSRAEGMLAAVAGAVAGGTAVLGAFAGASGGVELAPPTDAEWYSLLHATGAHDVRASTSAR